jgi:hypothetical protein
MIRQHTARDRRRNHDLAGAWLITERRLTPVGGVHTFLA